MSGTLFGLGLSQQMDLNGRPMAGCLLYVYEANSSTPAITYRNFALTAGQEHPFPIVADANGRIPAFWVEDGSYRARLTNAVGVPQFDEASMEAIGASLGGGGGGDTTDVNSVASTGDIKWRAGEEVLAGWVKLNGTTIGSSTSGADSAALANQALFLYAWNNFPNTMCVIKDSGVAGARGASAAVDWAANRQISVLDMRGRSPFGLADMGSTDNNMFQFTDFDVGDATTGGSIGGEPSHQLTWEEMPAHDHGFSDPQHSHGISSGGNELTNINVTGANTAAGTADTSTSNASTGISFDTAGDDDFHNNMTPFMLGTWYWRL